MDFLEIKQRLHGDTSEYHCTLLEHTPDRLILHYQIDTGGTFAGLTFPAGTITLAYYWPHHPYNLYHWLTPDGQTIAFYINLSTHPTITATSITWQDLIIDILITPDPRFGYRIQVLDEDELPADLDPTTRHHIDHILQEALSAWPALVRHISAYSQQLWDTLEQNTNE